MTVTFSPDMTVIEAKVSMVLPSAALTVTSGDPVEAVFLMVYLFVEPTVAYTGREIVKAPLEVLHRPTPSVEAKVYAVVTETTFPSPPKLLNVFQSLWLRYPSTDPDA